MHYSEVNRNMICNGTVSNGAFISEWVQVSLILTQNLWKGCNWLIVVVGRAATMAEEDTLKIYWEHFFKAETGTYEVNT